MVRCMANNYSPLGFWRSWHRSYNLWIVRYLYVPLGGAHRLVATSVLIFTFVALWHDLSPRLLAWGWLAALFILPEVTARRALPPSMVRSHDTHLIPFYLCFLCAVWGTVVVSSRVCCWRCLQYPDDDGREPRRICCWYGRRAVPRIPTSQQLERWVSRPECSVLLFSDEIRAQVFVSSWSHVSVCLLAYNSCSSTGVFDRLCTRITTDCFDRLGRKSYVAEYTVDVECLWVA
jgi:hypothetical protein